MIFNLKSRSDMWTLLNLALLWWNLPSGQAQDQGAHPSLRGSNANAQQSQQCPDLGVKVAFYLDATTMNTFYEASRLINLHKVEDLDFQDEFGLLKVWQDCDDAMGMAKGSDNQCIVSFCPGINPVLETMRNMNPYSTQMNGTDCRVRRGYSYVYDKSTFGNEFRQSLQECLASCGNVQCGLVLTGHSIGGAMAVAAAIDLRQYSPMIVTFGATQSIIKSDGESGDACNDFTDTSHYQFVNVVNGEYDSVPMVPSPFGGIHRGHLLFLDDTDYMIGYPGLNKNEEREPMTSSTHGWKQYQEKFERLKNSPCMPLAVAKWGAGHSCHYDDECDSGTCQDTACV